MTSATLPSLTTPPSRDAIAQVAAERVRHALFGGAPPATLGRYRCGEVIGSGGQGTVFLGTDPLLRRNVALKLVDTAAEPSAVRQVLREAQLLARVGHPNIAAVFDVGIVGRRVYLALELVEGGTLRSWLDHAPRSAAAILEQMTQVADALAFAHRCGVLHCDVKPQNVLVGRDGRARVVDFGLARLCAPTLDLAITLPGVAPGSVPDASRPGGGGTPAYAAPEIWCGEPASARSDQFSFCVMVYEALVGHRPWSTTPGQSRVHDPEQPLPRPSSGSKLAGHSIPGWLHRLLATGLQADPSARHASMEDLCAALRRPRGAMRRRLGAAVVTVGLASAAASTLDVRADAPVDEADACEPPAVTLRDRLQRGVAVSNIAAIDPTVAATAIDRLDGFARRTASMQVAACRDDPGVRRCGVRRADEHAAALAVLAEDRVHTRGELGAILDGLEATDVDPWCSERALQGPAGELLAKAQLLLLTGRTSDALMVATLACADLADGSIDAAVCDVVRGEALLIGGRRDEAQTVLQGAHDVAAASGNLALAAAAAERLIKLATDADREAEAEHWIAALEAMAARTDEPRLVFMARLSHAQLVAKRGNYEEAAVVLDALVAGDYTHKQLANVEALLGVVRGRTGEPALAHRHFARALELASHQYGGAVVATTQVFLAQQLVDEGRYDEALVAYRTGYDLAIADQGSDSVVAIHARAGMGDVLARLGRLDEALALADLAVEHALARDDPQDRTIALVTRANVLNTLERYTEARRDAVAAVSIGEAEIGAVAETRNARLALAAALEGLGDLAHARQVARVALDESEEIFGRGHIETMTAVLTLATIVFAQGDVHEAIALHTRARDAFESTFGHVHPGVATECYNLAEAWLRLDRPDLAVTEASCAVEVWREVLGDDHVDTRDAAAMLAVARERAALHGA